MKKYMILLLTLIASCGVFIKGTASAGSGVSFPSEGSVPGVKVPLLERKHPDSKKLTDLFAKARSGAPKEEGTLIIVESRGHHYETSYSEKTGLPKKKLKSNTRKEQRFFFRNTLDILFFWWALNDAFSDYMHYCHTFEPGSRHLYGDDIPVPLRPYSFTGRYTNVHSITMLWDLGGKTISGTLKTEKGLEKILQCPFGLPDEIIVSLEEWPMWSNLATACTSENFGADRITDKAFKVLQKYLETDKTNPSYSAMFGAFFLYLNRKHDKPRNHPYTSPSSVADLRWDKNRIEDVRRALNKVNNEFTKLKRELEVIDHSKGIASPSLAETPSIAAPDTHEEARDELSRKPALEKQIIRPHDGEGSGAGYGIEFHPPKLDEITGHPSDRGITPDVKLLGRKASNGKIVQRTIQTPENSDPLAGEIKLQYAIYSTDEDGEVQVRYVDLKEYNEIQKSLKPQAVPKPTEKPVKARRSSFGGFLGGRKSIAQPAAAAPASAGTGIVQNPMRPSIVPLGQASSALKALRRATKAPAYVVPPPPLATDSKAPSPQTIKAYDDFVGQLPRRRHHAASLKDKITIFVLTTGKATEEERWELPGKTLKDLPFQWDAINKAFLGKIESFKMKHASGDAEMVFKTRDDFASWTYSQDLACITVTIRVKGKWDPEAAALAHRNSAEVVEPDDEDATSPTGASAALAGAGTGLFGSKESDDWESGGQEVLSITDTSDTTEEAHTSLTLTNETYDTQWTLPRLTIKDLRHQWNNVTREFPEETTDATYLWYAEINCEGCDETIKVSTLAELEALEDQDACCINVTFHLQGEFYADAAERAKTSVSESEGTTISDEHLWDGVDEESEKTTFILTNDTDETNTTQWTCPQITIGDIKKHWPVITREFPEEVTDTIYLWYAEISREGNDETIKVSTLADIEELTDQETLCTHITFHLQGEWDADAAERVKKADAEEGSLDGSSTTLDEDERAASEAVIQKHKVIASLDTFRSRRKQTKIREVIACPNCGENMLAGAKCEDCGHEDAPPGER